MPDTPSQTSIVNDALGRLGSRIRLTSIATDTTKIGQAANAAWGPALRLLLAAHPWNFAIRRRELNDTETPAFGYDYAYTLPADNLKWLPPSREDGCDYFVGVQEGNAILTDTAAPLPCRYVSREWAEDMTRWPPHFAEAMTCEMMKRLAEPVTQSESAFDTAAEEAKAALKAAKRADGLSTGNRSRARVTTGSNWLSARLRPYNGEGER